MNENARYPDWDLKDRDRYILGELADDPTLSAQELRDLLEEKYGIDVSRVTVSESIRQMREEGVFRETVIPNEEYLFFSLFEYQFFPPNFAAEWRAAMEFIRSDEHTLFFFLADGQYQWKSVMIFRDIEQQSRWIHEFYKAYGDLILDLKNTVVTNVLKFSADPEVFRTLLKD
ncbi:winged helix-turn-helix domain-containing protein [Halogeometricum sp. S1BR25-6]|uniref:Winged helix-turn-helix domain-containing protein n=1 Tax=Halogeometricum salsisoli TaxID=2950536 RepID=A0ABU2GHB3_9EURY|nr:winged helix-turn-helix domain-containing protein [Halogeometricum sp. S1BR25-6]MDS0300192.1 winged helix-turn-helix domain-containing protein [Halogeometricum sp. S1BR25-6]